MSFDFLSKILNLGYNIYGLRQPIGITNTPSSRLYPYCDAVITIFKSGNFKGHCGSVEL